MSARDPAPPAADGPPFRRLGDVFYATRVLRGREWSLRRFAPELGIDHVYLSLIEKGQRLPGEDLVRTLATIRGEEPRALLAMLVRERIVRALARELRRGVAAAPGVAGGPSDDEEGAPGSTFAVVSRAVAALPDSGDPVRLPAWRRSLREALRAEHGVARRGAVEALIADLRAKGVVEISDQQVRKLRTHVVASGTEQQVDLAVDLAWIFAKSLTDKMIRHGGETYLRNHFLRVAPDRMRAFRRSLDEAIRRVAEEFDADEDDAAELVRVLVAGTSER